MEDLREMMSIIGIFNLTVIIFLYSNNKVKIPKTIRNNGLTLILGIWIYYIGLEFFSVLLDVFSLKPNNTVVYSITIILLFLNFFLPWTIYATIDQKSWSAKILKKLKKK
jgi:hypothetical protein